MNITVNGEQKSLSKDCSIAELLGTLQLENAFVAVAINNTCVSRSQYEDTYVQDNDKIEILAPMAGG